MATITCPCPKLDTGEPRHAEDSVEFRERLSLTAALTIRNHVRIQIDREGFVDVAEVLAMLTEQYIVHGIETWTLADDLGPITVSRPAIAKYILDDFGMAAMLGDIADELYSGQVMLPLVKAGLLYSQASQTGESTSPMNGASQPSPKRSRRSSTTTTRTDDTGTIT